MRVRVRVRVRVSVSVRVRSSEFLWRFDRKDIQTYAYKLVTIRTCATVRRRFYVDLIERYTNICIYIGYKKNLCDSHLEI